MKHDIRGYRVISRIAIGDKAMVFLQSTNDTEDVFVLEMIGVVGSLDITKESDLITWLRIDDRGGSYNWDLSLRLRKPEIKEYPEVFIFIDDNCVNLIFRAVAKTIKFRQVEEPDKRIWSW